MKKSSRLVISLVPFTVLVILLSAGISIFGSDSILGASQVSLLIASGVALVLGMWLFKTPWAAFEKAVRGNVGDVATAIIILLLIGAISGTWTVSGIVPAFICYGVKIIHPKVFLLTACIICALVSVMTGSSWTTIATMGVALMGIGKAEGFSDGMIAGAIISGAYFGDKISPLSDTTVLASAINRVPLFPHIRYMLITTVPSIAITLLAFTVIGLSHSGGGAPDVQMYTDVLNARFNITPWLMVVPVLTAVMIWRKWPAPTVLAAAVLLAAAAALVFQRPLLEEIGSGVTEGSSLRVLFAGVVESTYNSLHPATGNADVDALVATKGMLGMLNTIFLIICAMCFGGCMKAGGMIDEIASALRRMTRKRTALVGSTVCTGVALNGLICDQYLAIILTSNIFGDAYRNEGYEGRLLSRSVEDSATVTSPLFPWSSCGMTQASILSVPTLTYAPFCFFNIISPLMSITVAAIGYKIVTTAARKDS